MNGHWKNVYVRIGLLMKKDKMKLQNRGLTSQEKTEVKVFLLGNPIVQVKKSAIKADENGTAIENAKKWAKNHSQEIIRSDIGKVVFASSGVRNSLSHKFSQRKLDAVQAIPSAIKLGKVVSISDDFDGKPIKNIILVAPVQIGDNEKCFLCIRLVKNVGNDSRLHIHEVFDTDGLKNTAIPFQTPGTDLTARPQRGIAIYINILRDILDVKS
jgi:hypothetical protein